MLQRTLLVYGAADAGVGSGGAASASAVSLTVRHIRRDSFAFTLPWTFLPPPSQQPLSSSSSSSSSPPSRHADDGAVGEYITVPRSAFSVLRGKRSAAGCCTTRILQNRSVGRPCLPSHPCARTGTSAGSREQADCPGAWCCCAALVFPRAATDGTADSSDAAASLPAHQEPVEVSTSAEDERCAFVLGLKMSGTESTLRELIGEDAYKGVVGEVLARDGQAAALCADPAPLLLPALDGTDRTSTRRWEARMLLSEDEASKVKWLWEEAEDYGKCYMRAPTLRSLFVIWSIAASSPLGAGSSNRVDARVTPSPLVPHVAPVMPTIEAVDHVVQRMREHDTAQTLCDFAALAACARTTERKTQDSILRILANTLRAPSIAELNAAHGPVRTSLQLITALVFLCQHAEELSSEWGAHTSGHDDSARRPAAGRMPTSLSASEEHRYTTLLRVATEVSALLSGLTAEQAGPTIVSGSSDHATSTAAPLPALPHTDILISLASGFMRRVDTVCASYGVSATSEHLSDVTVWLLRMMPGSKACARHFQLAVERSPMDALATLERSKLLVKPNVSLTTVMEVVLPLVERCDNEDFFTLVMREVISSLEERLRRDAFSFTRKDMSLIAELGTRLFAVPLSEGSSTSSQSGQKPLIYKGFDTSVREQMEELHVMDGSPWALCVASYRSLKEIIQGLVRDQRKLKRQVQEQMRSIGIATGVTVSNENEAQLDASKPHAAAPTSSTSSTSSASASTRTDANAPIGNAADGNASRSDGLHHEGPSRLLVSPPVRQRFLAFTENLVKALVDEDSAHSHRPIVVSSDLFAFVNLHVPVPNIQDEYRRKIFLLVNVAEDPETLRQRRRERRREKLRRERQLAEEQRKAAEPTSDAPRSVPPSHGMRWQQKLLAHGGFGWGTTVGRTVRESLNKEEETLLDELEDEDQHGGAEEIPAELRFLVSSLPLTLSPWASVMILREVLAESAGRNPRYTYVLNAAIDLQLPISTTRSRIATTLNMWRFLNSQSHKLTLKESVVTKQRCAFNLPLSYILSSYWSLLTSLVVACIILLNVVGLDFESQLVANSLFQKFTPWEEVVDVELEPWNKEAAADLASDYFEQDEIASQHRYGSARRSTDVILSSASYLFLGYDDQRRPMTVIPISSDPTLSEHDRASQEYACAAAVLRELSLHAPFPFYLDLERPMSVEYVEMRVAERIRRVAFNNTWFLPRMVIRTFPLGRVYTERVLVQHTCTQANLTRRRITFLVYIQDGVPVTQQLLHGLQNSFLSESANLVLVVHERSLAKGGATPMAVEALSGTAPAGMPAVDGTGRDGSAEESTAAAMAARTADSGARRLRVLPYCRLLHDHPEGLFSGAATQTGSAASRSAKAAALLLSRASPFTRHFGFRVALDDATADRSGGSVAGGSGGGVFARLRQYVAFDSDDNVLTALSRDSVDAAAGVRLAATSLIVAPVRLATHFMRALLAPFTRAAEPGADGDVAAGGEPAGDVQRQDDAHASASSSHEGTNDGPLPAASSSRGRTAVSVPFSVVQAALTHTGAVGESARWWVGDAASLAGTPAPAVSTSSESNAGSSGAAARDASGAAGNSEEPGLLRRVWGSVCSTWKAVTADEEPLDGARGEKTARPARMWWTPPPLPARSPPLAGATPMSAPPWVPAGASVGASRAEQRLWSDVAANSWTAGARRGSNADAV